MIIWENVLAICSDMDSPRTRRSLLFGGYIQPGQLDKDRISLSSPEAIPGTASQRIKVLYRYGEGGNPSDLRIIPKNREKSLLVCAGVRNDSIPGPNGKKIELKRKVMRISLDLGEEGDVEFLTLLHDIKATVESMDSVQGHEIRLPTSNLVDNRGMLYARLIESNDGTMFTKAFDVERKDLDVGELGPCTIRPSMVITLIKTGPKINMRLSVSQVCIYGKVQSFPIELEEEFEHV
ncbi:MAG: hypothetical protein JWR43_2842 [Phenylobacterium sp.]|nr:hypothetical protein [Phenylobacterium sp.]